MSILRAKTPVRGRDKTPLLLRLRESSEEAPVAWASFKLGEKLQDIPPEELRAKVEALVDCPWGQFRTLAGLPDTPLGLQLAAHHTIFWANEANGKQKPQKVSEVGYIVHGLIFIFSCNLF